MIVSRAVAKRTCSRQGLFTKVLSIGWGTQRRCLRDGTYHSRVLGIAADERCHCGLDGVERGAQILYCQCHQLSKKWREKGLEITFCGMQNSLILTAVTGQMSRANDTNKVRSFGIAQSTFHLLQHVYW